MFNKTKEINKRLKLVYGTNLLGEPLFRIIFSDNEIEKRFGKFTDWYGKVFLREYVGLREVPKYAWIKGKYVLERWMPPTLAYTPEIPGTSQGSYEPIYVYQTATGEALEPIEDWAHKIIERILNPLLPGHRKELLVTEDERVLAEEVKYNEEVLAEAGRTWIGHRLHSKEAIVKP